MSCVFVSAVCPLFSCTFCFCFWPVLLVLFLRFCSVFVLDNVTLKEIIDEEDDKLKNLKREYGEQVYNAVTIALNERNEYNLYGRNPEPELWNFNENRMATLKEVALHIVNL
ncbi:hypothetical protein EZV62_027857 [Acer yangbiense]|uniref:Factor of DNA methylation 1-5/IDN2 domain-containing protein n=1 Tax=Acer yangbiense TaxID=1000413 RepID=A0A5C7GPY0_9ROSI|nr:hypothetical protein EZV62_027857 [Acer yangbiense]